MLRNLTDGWAVPLLILLAILLFGARRMPDAARSLGRSMRIFKSEIKEMQRDDDKTEEPAKPTKPLEGNVVDAQGQPVTKAEELDR
jgi:sec-independent protein translocase protein TatA